MQSGNVVATALAESLDKPSPWAVGFLFGNTRLSLELWNIIAGISGLDDQDNLRSGANGHHPGGVPYNSGMERIAWKLIALLTLALAVVACGGGGPFEADIDATVEARI